MEKQITINIPEGKEIKQEIDKDGNITIKFVDKEITRSKSWKEYCINHPNIEGEWLTDGRGIIFQQKDGYKRALYPECLETREDAEAIVTLIQLIRLHDEWVGDWKPINKNSYYAISYDLVHKKLIIDIRWKILQVLSFPTKDMANEFLECFYELIVKAKKFI